MVVIIRSERASGSLNEQILMTGGSLHTQGLRAAPMSKDTGSSSLCHEYQLNEGGREEGGWPPRAFSERRA